MPPDLRETDSVSSHEYKRRKPQNGPASAPRPAEPSRALPCTAVHCRARSCARCARHAKSTSNSPTQNRGVDPASRLKPLTPCPLGKCSLRFNTNPPLIHILQDDDGAIGIAVARNEMRFAIPRDITVIEAGVATVRLPFRATVHAPHADLRLLPSCCKSCCAQADLKDYPPSNPKAGCGAPSPQRHCVPRHLDSSL